MNDIMRYGSIYNILSTSTLYNVTVELGLSENGNVLAIHPRVIARLSAFGLPTRHSQSFKLTSPTFPFPNRLNVPQTSLSTHSAFLSSILSLYSHRLAICDLCFSLFLHLAPHLFSPRLSFNFLISDFCQFQTPQFAPVSSHSTVPL